jgi:hypothetical protein
MQMQASALIASLVVLSAAGAGGAAFPWENGPLQVAPNARFITHTNGRPFFYLADTGWELFHYLTRPEAELYLENRRAKGFTVIKACALPILDYLDTPNAYGHGCFINQNPAQPDVKPGPADDHWDLVDWVIDKAAEKGLYVALLPTWGKYVAHGGPIIFNTNSARLYGEWLGQRYASRPNIIWVLGGDRDGNANGTDAVWDAMGNAIKSRDSTSLMMYHPTQGNSSSRWFQNEPWLDSHMAQSGHYKRDNESSYTLIQADYSLPQPKPTHDGEPRYEDHPINWNAGNGYFDGYDARQAAYWSLFAGAFGHCYGHHTVWQFLKPPRTGWSSPLPGLYWTDALDRPGARQMKHVRSLLLSRPFLSRVPDQSIIAGDPGPHGPHHLRATRGDGYAMVYNPSGRNFSVNLGKISGAQVRAWWFDPRTGDAVKIGTFANTGTRAFDPPGTEGRGNDWVLVLDDAARNFGAPGAEVRLSINRSGDTVLLSWLASETNCLLEYADNLSSPTNWAPHPTPPLFLAEQNTYLVVDHAPAAVTNRVYRLREH